LQARASLLDSGLLALGFTLMGDLEELTIPTEAAPVFTERLWEHTCFEAFLALESVTDYWELNLSPSTAWAAYAFTGYRSGGRPAEEAAPRIVAHVRPGRLEIHALARIPKAMQGRPLRLGLAAVLESNRGDLTYWALQHPSERPDFHQAEAFTWVLPTWTDD
jgi:hypothetical protein